MLILIIFAVCVYKDKEGELIIYNEVNNPEISLPIDESKNFTIISDTVSRHIYENEMRSLRSSLMMAVLDRR